MNIDRRGFLGSLLALVVAPRLTPTPLRAARRASDAVIDVLPRLGYTEILRVPFGYTERPMIFEDTELDQYR